MGIGIIAIHALWEIDWDRLPAFMVSYMLYGTLQAINLVRYTAILDWSRFSAVAYTILIVSVMLAGACGT